MSIRNQKDTLAKLMATENITVVHKKVPTASFDVKNRVLTCPILNEELSKEVYDLFMGHEVGHALHTPFEGLHSTLSDNPTLKGYLNVIEDVRIERKIRDKFNGLRKSFYTAYKELMEMDFFGINGVNLQELALIDKINLISKVGSSINIKLDDVGESFLQRAFLVDTWEEVVELAEEIYQYSQKEETLTALDEHINPQVMYSEEEDDDESDSEDYDSYDSQLDEEDDNSQSEEDEEEDESDNTSSLPSEEDEDEEEMMNINDGESARESITEYNSHQNQDIFVSSENQLNFTIDLKERFRKIDMTKRVISYKTIFDYVADFENTQTRETTTKLSKWTAKKLVEKNKKIVNHMAKEFEMRQSAHVSMYAHSSKTGRLDPNKLATYQVVDDVFQRTMMVPKGKNHGMTLMLDWSGSIHYQLPNLIEQALILVMFCQKVQIPFRVYAFSNFWESGSAFTVDEGNLLELFSNEMNNKQFKRAIEIISIVYNAFMTRGLDYREVKTFFDGSGVGVISANLPERLALGGTPLDECLILMRKSLHDFNNKYKIEKSVLTVLTDGYSHKSSILSLDNDQNREMFDGFRASSKMTRTIIDPVSRKSYVLPISRYDESTFETTQILLDWVSKECNCTVTGFFVLNKKREYVQLKLSLQDNSSCFSDEILRKEWLELRKTGKVLTNVVGYNKLILTTNTKASDDDGLDSSLAGEKKGKILNAFRKNQKGKVTSRFIANEYMKEIA